MPSRIDACRGELSGSADQVEPRCLRDTDAVLGRDRPPSDATARSTVSAIRSGSPAPMMVEMQVAFGEVSERNQPASITVGRPAAAMSIDSSSAPSGTATSSLNVGTPIAVEAAAIASVMRSRNSMRRSSLEGFGRHCGVDDVPLHRRAPRPAATTGPDDPHSRPSRTAQPRPTPRVAGRPMCALTSAIAAGAIISTASSDARERRSVESRSRAAASESTATSAVVVNRNQGTSRSACCGDHRQGPLGPGEHRRPVEAGRLLRKAVERSDDASLRRDRFDADDLLSHRAEPQHPRPAGVGGDRAADVAVSRAAKSTGGVEPALPCVDHATR